MLFTYRVNEGRSEVELSNHHDHYAKDRMMHSVEPSLQQITMERKSTSFIFLHRLLIVYIFYKLYILYCINCIHCF